MCIRIYIFNSKKNKKETNKQKNKNKKTRSENAEASKEEKIISVENLTG